MKAPDNQSQTASSWRIELATELMQAYVAKEGIRMIVLGGSPSKNLADRYSDLDIVVYWDAIDRSWIDTIPLASSGGDRKFLLSMGSGDSCMELYYFGPLIVEVGHITLAAWKELVSDVLDRHEISPFKQKSLAGFLAAYPIYGEPLVRHWQERISVYPEQLASKMVRQSLGFFWRGCLLNQGLERGDILFFYDGICMMLKKLLSILAGLNRIYFSPVEPRWIEYELSRMPIRPDDMWQRIQSIFDGDRKRAVGILEDLIGETLKLVDRHMPELDLSMTRRLNELEIRACDTKPKTGNPGN